MGRVTQKADLEPLIALGLVTREVAFASPRRAPRSAGGCACSPIQGAIAGLLPTLGHTSLEADILAWLAAQEDPLPPVASLCRALGCTPAHVSELARRGRFTLLPSRTWIRRCIGDAGLPQALAALSRSAKKAQALAALPVDAVEEAGFRAAHQVDATTLRALAAQGLAERSEEPGQVSLAISRDTVVEAILVLRGGQKHRHVLDALQQRQDGSLGLRTVYEATGATADTLRDLETAGLIAIEDEVVWRDPLAGQEFKPDQPPRLTPDQERVWATVEAGVLASRGARGQGSQGAETPGDAMLLRAGGGDGRQRPRPVHAMPPHRLMAAWAYRQTNPAIGRPPATAARTPPSLT